MNQIQGASVSVMSNIAEGFSRKSNKAFSQFLFISKSSAAEVQSQLYVALDQNYITKETFQQIYDQAEIVSKLNSGFIKYLKSQLNKLKKPNKLKNSTNPMNSTNPTNSTNPKPMNLKKVICHRRSGVYRISPC